MLTGSNPEMAFGFTIIDTIEDITLRLINQVKAGYFVDFIFEGK